jgi:hypothetical protein
MTYKESNAAYALRSYVWKLLRVNLGWDQNDYGLVPIITLAQQPEVMQSGKPFLVYGSAFYSPNHLYALRGESISFNIFSTDVDEANTIANLLMDTFERQDESASDVNDWIDLERENGKDRNVSFATINAVLVEKAVPSDDEGGFVSALVMLDTKYTSERTPVTQFIDYP